MIRAASHKDIATLSEMWSICFGDDQSFAEEFFQRSGAQTAVICCDGKDDPVGMINMIPVRHKMARGTYLYAICVLPEYRGRGLFTRLCEYARERSVANGDSFLCLIPGTERLYHTYKRLGFSEDVALSRYLISEPFKKAESLAEDIISNGINVDEEGITASEEFNVFLLENSEIFVAESFAAVGTEGNEGGEYPLSSSHSFYARSSIDDSFDKNSISVYNILRYADKKPDSSAYKRVECARKGVLMPLSQELDFSGWHFSGFMGEE